MGGVEIDVESAEVYARWFQALADPTRIRILNLLACRDEPMTVGEVVAEMALGQSTVSHHLKILYVVGFVTRRRQGTSSYYQVNHNCVTRFPTAADLVMGRLRQTAMPRTPVP